MPQYVLLMKLTEKGAAAIVDAPRRIDEAIVRWEQMGGTMTVFCATMGEYDYVAVGEAPTDERAAAFALALSQQGNVKTTTLRGFTRQDLAVMLEASRRGHPADEDQRPTVRRDEPDEDQRPHVRRDEPDEDQRPTVRRPEPPEPPAPEPSE